MTTNSTHSINHNKKKNNDIVKFLQSVITQELTSPQEVLLSIHLSPVTNTVIIKINQYPYYECNIIENKTPFRSVAPIIQQLLHSYLYQEDISDNTIKQYYLKNNPNKPVDRTPFT